MELIDTNLDSGKSQKINQPLNGLLLAAYLLLLFSDYCMTAVYQDMRSGDVNDSGYLSLLINLALTLGGAFLSHITGQTRILNIIGVSLLICLNIVAVTSDYITGYPMIVLFYLASGLVTFPLLKRLVAHTEFFGPAQQVLFFSLVGCKLLVSFFLQIVHTSGVHGGDVPMTVVSCLSSAIALILIIVDNEKEPEQNLNLQDYTSDRPDFWTKSFLPLVLVGLVIHWMTSQTTRVYYISNVMEHENPYKLVVSFASVVLAMGLLLLMVRVLAIKNPWTYFVVGGAITFFLILMYVVGPADTSDYSWIFSILNAIGTITCSFGFTLWLYQHASFPYLAVLLALPYLLNYISYTITDYFDFSLMHFMHPLE